MPFAGGYGIRPYITDWVFVYNTNVDKRDVEDAIPYKGLFGFIINAEGIYYKRLINDRICWRVDVIRGRIWNPPLHFGGDNISYSSKIPSTVLSNAKAMADYKRLLSFKENSKEIKDKAVTTARNAFIDFRVKEKSLPRIKAAKGVSSDISRYKELQHRAYKNAVLTANNTLAKESKSLIDRLDKKREQDIRSYVSSWRSGYLG